MSRLLLNSFRLACWTLAAATLMLFFVVPVIARALINTGAMSVTLLESLAYVEWAQQLLMLTLAMGWLFFVGSSFGSFLNVVALRLPRGRNITGNSHCPGCDTQLKFSDNLPVAGWIRTGGKCRTCKIPISPRYLIVELISGSIFLLISGLVIFGGGVNLPLRTNYGMGGLQHLIFHPNWDLIQIAIYHLVLANVLFTFALIRLEKQKIPLSIFCFGLTIGMGLPFVWPQMSVVSWQIETNHPMPLTRFSGNQLLTIALGLGLGFTAGWFFRREETDASEGWFGTRDFLLNPSGNHSLPPAKNTGRPHWISGSIASFTLVGVFLGWQSVLSIALILLLINALSLLVTSKVGIDHWNLPAMILAATLIHWAMWRASTIARIWPSPAAHWSSITMTMLVLVFAAWMRKR